MSNEGLSVVIPTYNKADFLDFLLEKHICSFEKHKIKVFIYNNASTDRTNKVIAKWEKKSKLIISKTNDGELLSADESIENALKLSDTEYRWLLGDTYYLSPELIRHVAELISKNDVVDLYVVNLNDIIVDALQSKYYDANELLSTIATVMACVSCLIYHKSIVLNGDFIRHRNTHYGQIGVVLEYISDRNFCIGWIQEYSVLPLVLPGIDKKNWSYGKDVLEISARGWTRFIFSLPKCYSLESRLSAIKNFGSQTKLFTLSGIAFMRIKGNLTYSSYVEYLTELRFFFRYPGVAMLVSVIPRKILRIVCLMVTNFFNKKKQHAWCSYE